MTERREIDLGIEPAAGSFDKTELWVIQLRLADQDGYSWFVSDRYQQAKEIYRSYKVDGWCRWHRPSGLGFFKLVDTIPQTKDSGLTLNWALCGQGRDIILQTALMYDYPQPADDDFKWVGDYPVTLHVSLFNKDDFGKHCVFTKTSAWSRAPTMTPKNKMHISPWAMRPCMDVTVSDTGAGGYYCWMTLCDVKSPAAELWAQRRTRILDGLAMMQIMKAERWSCVSAPDDIMEWYDRMPPVYSSCWSIPSPLDGALRNIEKNIS